MRRPGRSRRGLRARLPSDPFLALSADFAWRADDALHNGVSTTSLPSYLGSLTLLPDPGIGLQLKPAVSASLNGQMSITWSAAAAYGYSRVLPGGVPTAYTAVHVFRPTSVGMDDGAHGLTVGGTFGTGSYGSFFSPGSVLAHKVANNIVSVGAAPISVIAVCCYDAAGTQVNANSYTTQTVADVGALTGSTFTIGALDSGGVFTLDGEWCTTALFLRVLNATEKATCLRLLGARYGVTISP